MKAVSPLSHLFTTKQ